MRVTFKSWVCAAVSSVPYTQHSVGLRGTGVSRSTGGCTPPPRRRKHRQRASPWRWDQGSTEQSSVVSGARRRRARAKTPPPAAPSTPALPINHSVRSAPVWAREPLGAFEVESPTGVTGAMDGSRRPECRLRATGTDPARVGPDLAAPTPVPRARSRFRRRQPSRSPCVVRRYGPRVTDDRRLPCAGRARRGQATICVVKSRSLPIARTAVAA